MKTLGIMLLLCSYTLLRAADGTNAPLALKVGQYISLPSDQQGAGGFLQYTGQHAGITFCALSLDIGSAMPSEDLRLYAQVDGKYSLVLSLPMLTRKGYRCTREADTLNVYLTRTYKEDKAEQNRDLLLTLNLPQLVKAHTETPACGTDKESSTSTLQLAKSDFRLIREVGIQERDLFDVAIKAGMYKRKGTEYLPGAERGAVSVRGRTWHGSNGVGLVAYDPHMRRYAIYYLQEIAVPGHHLDIVYADDDLIFFSYGFHKELSAVCPALEVYSARRDCFARIAAVTSRSGKFGRSDMDALAAKRPGNIGPSMGWDHRPYAEKAWVSLSDSMLSHPERVTLREGVFTLSYNTGWETDEFVTTFQFAKEDIDREFDKIASHKEVMPTGDPLRGSPAAQP